MATLTPTVDPTIPANTITTGPSTFYGSSEELTHVSACSSSNLSITQASSERDSEDCYADVGFMFEGLQPSTLKRFTWGCNSTTSDSNDHNNNHGGDDGNNANDSDNVHNDNGTSVTAADTYPAVVIVRVALHVVDDEPGALQSGHYLWPGAPALAEYLVQQHQTTTLAKSALQQPRNVLELGAGSALLSLTALQLMRESLQCLVVSDHDPGTLERARDNYETTLEDLLESTETEEEQMDCINGLASIPVMFESLEWGDDDDTALRVAQSAVEHNSHVLMLDDYIDIGNTNASTHSTIPATFTPGITSEAPSSSIDRTGSGDASPQPQQHAEQQTSNPNHDAERNIFDLVLGSDLVYSSDVVAPLFRSVSQFMTPTGSFLLAQSLKLDDKTENCLQKVCDDLHLTRTILKTTGQAHGGVQIEKFAWWKQANE